MTLRQMAEKLLTVKNLPRDERTKLAFVLDTAGDGPLEGLLYEAVESHIKGRFEWYFKPDGTLRRQAA